MVDWTNERITSEAIQFAVEKGYPVPAKVELSERMSKSWGRAYPHNGVIKLNKRFVELNDENVVRALIWHETTHLKHPNHLKGFRNEMGKHGQHRHVYLSGLSIVVERYCYECDDCGKVYISARKLSIENYRCTACKSHIMFRGSVVSPVKESYQACALEQIRLNQLCLMDF